MNHGHGHGHGHAHGHGQAEILDLDAELLADLTTDILDWLPVTDPKQVADLGAGTGAGTFALLDRFPHAHVTAVDSSAEHLRRLLDRARERGLADRVALVEADLDRGVPDLGGPGLAWASGSLHHLADPVRTLSRVRDALAPGGVLAVVEMPGMPRFFPESTADRDENLPHRGADWGPLLTAAGFTVEGHRTLTVHIERSERVERYARLVLGHHLGPEALEEALRRDDLALRAERNAWVARK